MTKTGAKAILNSLTTDGRTTWKAFLHQQKASSTKIEKKIICSPHERSYSHPDINFLDVWWKEKIESPKNAALTGKYHRRKEKGCEVQHKQWFSFEMIFNWKFSLDFFFAEM